MIIWKPRAIIILQGTVESISTTVSSSHQVAQHQSSQPVWICSWCLSLFLSLVTCHVQLYTFSSREEELIWPNGNWDCTSGIPILLPVPSPERNNTSEKIPSVSSMTSHGPSTYTLLKSPWHCLIFCMFCAARSPIHPLSGKFSNIWRKGS